LTALSHQPLGLLQGERTELTDAHLGGLVGESEIGRSLQRRQIAWKGGGRRCQHGRIGLRAGALELDRRGQRGLIDQGAGLGRFGAGCSFSRFSLSAHLQGNASSNNTCKKEKAGSRPAHGNK